MSIWVIADGADGDGEHLSDFSDDGNTNHTEFAPMLGDEIQFVREHDAARVAKAVMSGLPQKIVEIKQQ